MRNAGNEEEKLDKTLSFVKSLEPQIDFLFPTQQQKITTEEKKLEKKRRTF